MNQYLLSHCIVVPQTPPFMPQFVPGLYGVRIIYGRRLALALVSPTMISVGQMLPWFYSDSSILNLKSRRCGPQLVGQQKYWCLWPDNLKVPHLLIGKSFIFFQNFSFLICNDFVRYIYRLYSDSRGGGGFIMRTILRLFWKASKSKFKILNKWTIEVNFIFIRLSEFPLGNVTNSI